MWGKGGGKRQGVWDGQVYTAIFKMITIKELPYSTWTYCIAQDTLLHIMWQPGWEGGLEENGYMYMYG